MDQWVFIAFGFILANGKVGLNEVVYTLEEFRDPLMLKI